MACIRWRVLVFDFPARWAESQRCERNHRWAWGGRWHIEAGSSYHNPTDPKVHIYRHFQFQVRQSRWWETERRLTWHPQELLNQWTRGYFWPTDRGRTTSEGVAPRRPTWRPTWAAAEVTFVDRTPVDRNTIERPCRHFQPLSFDVYSLCLVNSIDEAAINNESQQRKTMSWQHHYYCY